MDNQGGRLIAGLTSLLLVGASLPLGAQALACPPSVTADQGKTLVDYVSKKYKLPDSVTLTLKQDRVISGSCYRELTFQGESQIRTWGLTLYASPDLRFLSSDLLDTALNPIEEERAKNDRVMKGLTERAVATRGPDNASVTIVEFSDFQCPFCRKFAQMLDEALSGNTEMARVVFRHFPLRNHAWARVAAEGAACAELQNSRAFWSLHDKVYRNQDVITAENVKDKLNEFAKAADGLDANAFKECMANSMSLGLVLRDMNLGEANQVSGTPTLFINGRKIEGVQNAARLRELIVQAHDETVSVANAAQQSTDSGQMSGTRRD